MERKINLFFNKWKNEMFNKPLLLYGSKQIGKTYSTLDFGHKEFKNVVYFNTENNKEVIEIFKKQKSTDKLIQELSLLANETILSNDTLLILDNVDNLDIIKGLRLIAIEKKDYYIIAITSRRDKLAEFKSEELLFKGMMEMDFEEYLWARDEKILAELIKECFEKPKTCPFHKTALEFFKEYLITGGLPEVVYANISAKNVYEIDSIKQKILDCIKKEILINENLIDISRGLEVLDSIPYQLKKSNKKFQYGILGTGKRAKEYENAINFLVNNQLLYRSYKITTVKSPLSSCREIESFKLYMPDDGILYSMMHLNQKQFTNNENLKETLYENHLAKTLVESGYALYYYQSQGKAEVNFVIQNRMGKIIPIEISTKSNAKAKSLSVFMKNHITTQAYRITENNFLTKKDIRYIPVYAIFCLNDTKI